MSLGISRLGRSLRSAALGCLFALPGQGCGAKQPAAIRDGAGASSALAAGTGSSGIVIEGHGPPANRVNYIIVGDGYTQADIDSGLYLAHVRRMIDDRTRKAGAVGRFTQAQQPYLRYRNFVNICAIKTVSVDSGIGTATKNTAFDGYLVDQIKEALAARAFARARTLIRQHHDEYPSDYDDIEDGYSRLLDCMEHPSAATRARAQSFFDEETYSTARRNTRRYCLEPAE